LETAALLKQIEELKNINLKYKKELDVITEQQPLKNELQQKHVELQQKHVELQQKYTELQQKYDEICTELQQKNIELQQSKTNELQQKYDEQSSELQKRIELQNKNNDQSMELQKKSGDYISLQLKYTEQSTACSKLSSDLKESINSELQTKVLYNETVIKK